MYDDQSVDVTEPDADSLDQSVGVFMPPLQAELELFKKSTGVDSVYDGEDEEQSDEDYEEEEQEDELDCIKRMAGLEPTVMMTAPNITSL